MTLPVLRLVRAEENPSDSGCGRTPGVSVRWCPLVVYLQSAEPPSSALSSSPLWLPAAACCSRSARSASLARSLTQSLLGVGGRTRRGRVTGPGGERSVCVCVVREWVCVWLPKLETVTYKRDTDGLLSYVGAEYAKTCVVVEFPPSFPLLLFPSSSLVRPLLRCADCSEWILRPGAGLCFGCAAAPPRIQTVGEKEAPWRTKPSTPVPVLFRLKAVRLLICFDLLPGVSPPL